jgi:hypothetical protein
MRKLFGQENIFRCVHCNSITQALKMHFVDSNNIEQKERKFQKMMYDKINNLQSQIKPPLPKFRNQLFNDFTNSIEQIDLGVQDSDTDFFSPIPGGSTNVNNNINNPYNSQFPNNIKGMINNHSINYQNNIYNIKNFQKFQTPNNVINNQDIFGLKNLSSNENNFQILKTKNHSRHNLFTPANSIFKKNIFNTQSLNRNSRNCFNELKLRKEKSVSKFDINYTEKLNKMNKTLDVNEMTNLTQNSTKKNDNLNVNNL